MNIIFYFQCNVNHTFPIPFKKKNHTFPIVPLYTLFLKHYFYFAFMTVIKKSIDDRDNLVKFLFPLF